MPGSVKALSRLCTLSPQPVDLSGACYGSDALMQSVMLTFQRSCGPAVLRQSSQSQAGLLLVAASEKWEGSNRGIEPGHGWPAEWNSTCRRYTNEGVCSRLLATVPAVTGAARTPGCADHLLLVLCCLTGCCCNVRAASLEVEAGTGLQPTRCQHNRASHPKIL